MPVFTDQLGAISDLQGGREVSAAEIAQQVALRSGHLAARGVTRRSIVFIAHGGSIDFFLDLLAIWTCGATAACLDPTLTAPEMQNLVAFCRPVALLTHSSRPQALDVQLGAMDLSVESTSVAVALDPPDLDDAALLLFTSGTTGTPKGVLLSFRAVLARVSLNAAEIGTAALSRTLAILPTHFGHGLIGNSLTPLLSGGTLVLPRTGIQLSQGLSSLIDAQRISFLSSVPSFWHLALRGTPPQGGTLKRVHVGSAPLSAPLWTRIAAWTGCNVVNCYGITETANWIGGASSRDGIVDGKVGIPWGGRAAVVGEDGRLLAVGAGEIAVQTPGLMSGYFQRPDATEAVLRDGWYRTGDIGVVDADGAITLSGRHRDEINRAGMKIQPADLDMLMERHPDVAEACCFGVPDPIAGETVAIAIHLKADGLQTADSLRTWCAGQIRREAIPERWFFVQGIPRTARGKVSRDRVRDSLMPTGKPGAGTA